MSNTNPTSNQCDDLDAVKCWRFITQPTFFQTGPWSTGGEWQGYSVGLQPKGATVNASIMGRGQTLETAVLQALRNRANCADETTPAQKHYPEEWGPSDARRLSCACGDPDPGHMNRDAVETPSDRNVPNKQCPHCKVISAPDEVLLCCPESISVIKDIK